MFGNTRDIRDGWLVVGKDLSHDNFSLEVYNKFFEGSFNEEGPYGGRLLGTTKEIERVRPKSPPKD